MSERIVTALWRPDRRRDWQAVEIVSDHPGGGLVLREVTDRFWPGIFLAARDQVRIAGPEFEVRA